MKLSPALTNIWRSLARFEACEGRPPTYRELATECGLKSPGALDNGRWWRPLKDLVEMKLIVHDRDIARGLRIARGVSVTSNGQVYRYHPHPFDIGNFTE